MIMKIPTSPIDYGCHDQSNDFDSDYEQIYDDLLLEIDSDFSEYLWMENEEEFDKMEMQRLEEEALMEQCIEAMLHDEMEAEEDAAKSGGCSIQSELCTMEPIIVPENSTLNPMAAEFVPSMQLITAAS